MTLGWSRLLVASALVTSLAASSGCKKEGVFFYSLAPASGRASGGQEVRIRGSGFRSLGNLEVRIGPKVASNVGIADDETIVLTTPDCRETDQGKKLDIFILTSDGKSYVLRESFTYQRGPGDTPGSELQRRL